MPELADFTATRLGGGEAVLSDYAGKVVLVVNVASECGKTPQYEGLEALYAQYGPDDFVVLGFPCNQFGAQEPGGDAQIAEFCRSVYGVDFPMFSKIEVNGPGAHPLYQWLKGEIAGAEGPDIEWNFVKFLIGRDGRPVERFNQDIEPAELTAHIEATL